MADVLHREEFEGNLAKILGKLQRAQMGQLLELMGDPPRLENVPASFWDTAGKELQAAISPFIQKIYLQQAELMMEEATVGVDWALVNQMAVDAARAYTFDLVRGIMQTSREALQSTVSSYFSEGWTMGDLTERLTSIFGPVRAEMIAVTEVTRAASMGEQGIAGELSKMGIEMIPYWETNNDELVCPFCASRHRKPITDGIYPPGHPRCRCFCNHRLSKST